MKKLYVLGFVVLIALVGNSIHYNYDAYQKSQHYYYYTVVDKVQYNSSRGGTVSNIYIRWDNGSTNTWSVHPLTYKWKDIGDRYKKKPKYTPLMGISGFNYLPDNLVSGFSWFINLLSVVITGIILIFVIIGSILELSKRKD